MQIAVAIGLTISTIKDEAILSRKLPIARKADTVGVIIGVIDSLELGGEVS